MELTAFIDNFANQFEDTEASVFTSETKFHDLDEWGSLLALSIIAMVDDEYGVVVKSDELKNCVTVLDVYNLVNSKK